MTSDARPDAPSLAGLPASSDAGVSARVDACIDTALATNRAKLDRRGFYILRETHEAGSMFPGAPGGSAYVVKPAPHDARAVRVLAAVFRFLRERKSSILPETWVTEKYIVTPYFESTLDLSVNAGSLCVAERRKRLATCSRFLAEFRRINAELEAMLQREQLSPRQFPLMQRYETSCRLVSDLLGFQDLNSLIHAGPLLTEQAEYTLFCDAKPANFLKRQEPARSPASGAGQPVAPAIIKIDNDLLHFRIPVILEHVIAYFSHPFLLLDGGGLKARFRTQWQACQSSVTGAGIGRTGGFDRLIWYHLLRNFASAATNGQTEKARSMAGFLYAAAHEFRDLDIDLAFAARVRSWLGDAPPD